MNDVMNEEADDVILIRWTGKISSLQTLLLSCAHSATHICRKLSLPLAEVSKLTYPVCVCQRSAEPIDANILLEPININKS